jgi:hypothetical protein
MKDLGITKGEWIYDDGYEGAFVYAKSETGITTIAEMASVNSGDEMLIADAGNTAQKCGLLPSELLKQRDDAVDKVETLVGYLSIMALGKTPPELEAVIKEANEWIEITKAEER